MSARLPVATGALWFALLGGAAGWTIHLLASYPLVPIACGMRATWPLHLVTGATLLIAGGAALTGALQWRRLRRWEPGDDERGAARGRALFMAGAGAILSCFFVYVVAVEGLPAFLQDPCAGGA